MDLLEQGKGLLLALVFIDFITLYCLIFILLRKILSFKKKNGSGMKLYKQVIALFSCMTGIPAICVFAFALLFLNTGIETLFKTPVKKAIESAEQVSQIYINHMKWAMEDFVSGLGGRLSEIFEGQVVARDMIELILNEYTLGLDIDVSVFQMIGNDKIVLATSSFVLSLQFKDIPYEALLSIPGETRSFEDERSVFAIRKVVDSLDVYVIARRDVTPEILEHKNKIRGAVLEYTTLATQRLGLKFTFIAFFSSIVICLLLASILIGILFANRIIVPVNKLIIGAQRISDGNYDVPIKSKNFSNELDLLISSFNIMRQKLVSQRRELIIFHRQSAWRDIARKIAHEIKNPLTPIMLSADRLKNKYLEKIDDNKIFINCVDTIMRQVTCIQKLVTEFSDFARMPPPNFQQCNIVKIINDVLFIQVSANKTIKFKLNLSDDEFECIADSDKMNQILLNIIQNAVNSVTENNTVKGVIGSGCIEVSFFHNDKTYIIKTEDDGPGFSEDAIEHAFDPYYTTRENGSGLGLSIVYRIVSEHNGKVILSRSERLGGACVTLELPIDI